MSVLRLALLSVMLAASLCGQKQPPLETAWSLAAQGKAPEAIALLHTLVRQDPKNVDAHLLLGSLLSEANARDEAIAELKLAVGLRPRSPEALNALGETYEKFNLRKAARTSFEQAVALRPGFAVAQENLGALLLESGEQAAAAPHLDSAIKLLKDANDAADARYLRAKIDATAGNYPAARQQLERTIVLRPDFAEAWSDLGIARRETQDEAGALAAFQRAVALNPDGAIAHYRLGVEYLRIAKPEQALAPLQEAYRLNPGDQSTLNSLQSALRQTGRTTEAAAIRQQLAELLHARDVKRQNTVKALAINNEGAALEKAGHLPEALTRYQQAANLDPDHAGVRSNLAIALLRLGHWTEGLTELRTALEQNPEDTQLQLALADALAKAPRDLLPAWAKEQATKP